MTRALGVPWQPADQALRPSLSISAAPTMQEPTVADMHLRRPHLTLADIGMPRLELPEDERVGQRVQIAADGGL